MPGGAVARNEPRDRLVPHGPSAEMGRQMHIRAEAAGHGDEVAGEPARSPALLADLDATNAMAAERARHHGARDDARAGPFGERRDRGRDLGRGSTSAATSTPAAARSAITPCRIVVIGEDDRAPAGQRGKAVDIGADGAGEHHARPVVVAEHERALDRAGGQHAALGDDAPGSLARLEGWGHRRHGR